MANKPNKSELVYKVIVGAFTIIENAKERMNFLQAHGIGSLINLVELSSGIVFQVQAGAFFNKKNAENQLREVKKIGIFDAYIFTERNGNGVNSLPILGRMELTAIEMNLFVLKVNEDSILLGQYYERFGEYYGIRGDIAFAQAILETDFFRFTGVVKPEQNNFAGIGTTGPTEPGATFGSPREGVLAQIQHLFAYASKEVLPEKYPLVDPRFHLVPRGSAYTWLDLNGRWAVPGESYGQTILNIYERMKNVDVGN